MSAVVEKPSIRQLLEDMQSSLEHQGITGVIHKVEISKKGDLQSELLDDGTPRWYDWVRNEPIERLAVNDRKVPLASRLKDAKFSASTRILSYRPGKRLTLLDSSGNKAIIIKGFRPGRLEPMVARYETAHLAFSGHGINTPEVIEFDHKNQCLVTVCQPGERLHLSADTTDYFYQVGEALRGFQDFEPAANDSLFDSRAELEVIDQRAARLLMAVNKLPEDWADLRRRLELAWQQLPEPHFGLAHRDLHDKQFVQSANFLVLLDFDLMCKADVCLDPGNFLAHLVLRNLQGIQGATQRSIDACGKQLLLGLGRNEDPGFWNRLRFYQATSFCRLALLYSLRPAWQHLVPALLTMGNRCLDDFDVIGAS